MPEELFTRYGTSRVRLIEEVPGEPPQHVLRPEDIDTSGPAVGSFGKHEVEAAAANLVRFFQMRGGWVRFTVLELIEFARLTGFDTRKVLFGLTGFWIDAGGFVTIREAPPYLVASQDGTYCITILFIDRCKSSTKDRR